MRFALMIEAQQGLTYEEQLEIARVAERAGFEAMFRSDHYASFPGDGEGPTTDAWAVLAGLARETSTLGLGVLVSPVTFREPGNLVKLITTVDHMSGGRLEVGMGAGWNEGDHEPLGIPFPPIQERADRLEEQLAVLHGLLTEPDGWSFEGRYLRVRNARLRPGALDVPGRPRGASGKPRPRILTGGEGSPRGFRIAARWADEFNLSSSSAGRAAAKMPLLDEACREIGRDPATLARSAMVGTLIGRDPAELAKRAADLQAALGVDRSEVDGWLAERRRRWIIGTPDEARATVRRYADAGIERIMLQDFVPRDHAMIELMAQELIGSI